MFKLLKGGFCYVPENIGRKDILVAYGKVCRIEDEISPDGLWNLEIIDCSSRVVCPGFIDQHVHITGGGGEEGPCSRIPEIMAGEIAAAGVSTLVGVLGVDNVTRNIASLLAKARGLQSEGINSYIYTGSYSVPTTTLTGKVLNDIVFIDKVLGVGEIAISDYRSTHQTIQLLKELAWEAKVGGMIGGKAGVMHIHVGDGREGLKPLFGLLEDSDFPLDMFVPTHLNRNRNVFHQALEFARMGGNVDFTAGEKTGTGLSVPDAVELFIKNGVSMERITISSDGNGSIPSGNGGETGVGNIMRLFDDIRSCILDKEINMAQALKTVTANVARILKLYPLKGTIRVNSDADILVLNSSDLSLDTMLINGELFVKDGIVLKKGRYEKEDVKSF